MQHWQRATASRVKVTFLLEKRVRVILCNRSPMKEMVNATTQAWLLCHWMTLFASPISPINTSSLVQFLALPIFLKWQSGVYCAFSYDPRRWKTWNLRRMMVRRTRTTNKLSFARECDCRFHFPTLDTKLGPQVQQLLLWSHCFIRAPGTGEKESAILQWRNPLPSAVPNILPPSLHRREDR